MASPHRRRHRGRSRRRPRGHADRRRRRRQTARDFLGRERTCDAPARPMTPLPGYDPRRLRRRRLPDRRDGHRALPRCRSNRRLSGVDDQVLPLTGRILRRGLPRRRLRPRPRAPRAELGARPVVAVAAFTLTSRARGSSQPPGSTTSPSGGAVRGGACLAAVYVRSRQPCGAFIRGRSIWCALGPRRRPRRVSRLPGSSCSCRSLSRCSVIESPRHWPARRQVAGVRSVAPGAGRRPWLCTYPRC